MATIMPHNELVAKALKWTDERLADATHPEISAVLDEAGARFNLSPRESEALLALFQASQAAREGYV